VEALFAPLARALDLAHARYVIVGVWGANFWARSSGELLAILASTEARSPNPEPRIPNTEFRTPNSEPRIPNPVYRTPYPCRDTMN
jgi:hypothetical protein